MTKEIKVEKIKEGTVIDHISSGQALNVLRILGIAKDYPTTAVTVAMNVPSKKGGRKDIVKIEGRELKSDEVGKISLISPNATINIIRGGAVFRKKKVTLPERIEGVVRCSNPNCISNSEPVRTRFAVERKEPIKLRCFYCERVMVRSDITRQF
ncbi:MAG: aspartate carbamoyltransferase regulatory subunit [Methanobacteriota archaeon]|nr:MAG: aspartate carbamoyltransferase regulatory subunit [Euryarchaeota archaeon]